MGKRTRGRCEDNESHTMKVAELAALVIDRGFTIDEANKLVCLSPVPSIQKLQQLKKRPYVPVPREITEAALSLRFAHESELQPPNW